jgi:hypothetical protein
MFLVSFVQLQTDHLTDVVDIGISGDGCVYHPPGGGYSAGGSGKINIGAHF